MRGLSPILILLCLTGCDPTGQLHLVLAPADPDPLEDAVELRVTYHDGLADVTVDLPLDDSGAESGVHGEEIADLRLEALDAEGHVLARGRLPGDLTPDDDGVLEATVVVLRVGSWSTVAGLELASARFSPCALALGDSRVLVTGGGSGTVEWLDLDRGTVETADLGLQSTSSGCQGVALDDGSVVIAGIGADAGQVERIDATSGAAMDSTETGRTGGVLVSVLEGRAAWWMGGDADEDDLTSELVVSSEAGLISGPTVAQGHRSAHAAACTRDGQTCAVFGCDAGPCGWWLAQGHDILAEGGWIWPTYHDQDLAEGTGRAGQALGESHVVGLLEHGGTTIRIFDLAGDGALDWEHSLSGDLVGAGLAVGAETAWIVGGEDSGGPTIATSTVAYSDDGAAWQVQAGAALQVARHDATAAGLDDGRIVVIGGAGESGVSLGSVEIYQP